MTERKTPIKPVDISPALPVLIGSASDQWLCYKGKMNHVDDIAAVMDAVAKDGLAAKKYEVALVGTEYHILKRNEHGVLVFFAKTGDNKAVAQQLCGLANANAGT